MSKEVKNIFNLHKADVNFSMEILKTPKNIIIAEFFSMIVYSISKL